MSPRRLRALDFREPAPEYEFADGLIVQTRYLDAAGWTLYEQYVADPVDVVTLSALLQAVAPALTLEYINARVTTADIVALIAIGKGHADLVLDARKNERGAAALALEPTAPIPPSSTTIPFPASSPASPAPVAAPS